LTILKASMDEGPGGLHASLSPEESTLVYRFLMERFTKEPPLGPLAIVCDGGLVQHVCSSDERLIGNVDIIVIDYDVDSAETVYAVPQNDPQDPTAESDAQIYGEAVTRASIPLAEVWRRYMADEVTLDCAKINAEAEGYRVRVVPTLRHSGDPAPESERYEWFTDEAVSFVDYEDEDAAWMAAYQDLVQ
jgi:hypothetical protein